MTAASVRTAAATAAPFVAVFWFTAAIAAAAADGYDQAAWWLLLLNLLVLAPAAVLAALWLGTVVGGRAIGLLSALLLVALPAVGVVYALASYRDTYVDRVLPEAVGIAAGGRFPAAALSLVAGALAIRGLTADGRRVALLAGLVAGDRPRSRIRAACSYSSGSRSRTWSRGGRARERFSRSARYPGSRWLRLPTASNSTSRGMPSRAT